MDQPTVTLIAASVGAVTSLLTFVSNIVVQRGAERRAATRKSLDSRIEELADAVTAIWHEVEHSVTGPGPIDTAGLLQQTEVARSTLGRLRRQLKFVFWRIDPALAYYEALPGAVADLAADPDRARVFVRQTERLRNNIEGIAWRSYELGRPPSAPEAVDTRFSIRRSRRARVESEPQGRGLVGQGSSDITPPAT